MTRGPFIAGFVSFSLVEKSCSMPPGNRVGWVDQPFRVGRMQEGDKVSIDVLLESSGQIAECWAAGDKDRARRIVAGVENPSCQEMMMGMTISTLQSRFSDVAITNGFISEVMNPHLSRMKAALYSPVSQEWQAKVAPPQRLSCDHSMWRGIESGSSCPGCGSLMRGG